MWIWEFFNTKFYVLSNGNFQNNNKVDVIIVTCSSNNNMIYIAILGYLSGGSTFGPETIHDILDQSWMEVIMS